MIELQFIGAAQTVTGSKHLLRTSRATVLLDCGLFQGHRQEAFARNRSLPIDVQDLDAVVLSHAHIDHSGALPVLYKKGYRGPVFATPATRDLCVPMLEDAASIQEADARHIRKLIERGQTDLEPVEPLYSAEDAAGLVGLMSVVSYHRRQVVAPGVSVTFLDAGHVLGSAIVVVDIEEEGTSTRLAFTGDLGRPHLPILRDPEVPEGVDILLTESTYGDRLHEPISETSDTLGRIIERVSQRGGKILIPSFALERAQEVIYELKQLRAAHRIPAIPVYVDSPLTVKLTDVFRLHADCYDEAALRLLQGGQSPFDFDGLHYVSSVEDSKAIDASSDPCIIIAASGMCEAGRVLHHLRSMISDSRHAVLIVGYQAQHTLGRRLVEQRSEVRIFGLMHHRSAEVFVLNGFSAHADQAGLLSFADQVRSRGQLRKVILVHGDPSAQRVLQEKLGQAGFTDVSAPADGERILLGVSAG